MTKVTLEEVRNFIDRNPDLNMRQIAKELSISTTSIRARIWRYNIPYKSKGKGSVTIPVQALTQYIEQNPSHGIYRIAKKFNAPRSTLQAYILRHNIPYKPKELIKQKTTKQDVINCISVYPEESMNKIAERLGISEGRVGQYIKRHNIPYKHKSSSRRSNSMEKSH